MCLIYDMKNCNMTAVDVPDSFLQADMEVNMVHMKKEGRTVEILTKFEPKIYQKHTQKEIENPSYTLS